MRAFTAESARRLNVQENPIAVPPFQLIDMNSKKTSFSDYLEAPVLVEFIYTQCPWLCYDMGASFKQLREKLDSDGNLEDIKTLSISFDPDNDNINALSNYGEKFNADGKNWNIAVIDNKKELQLLLDTFGVTLVPLPEGGYEHNAAIHLIDSKGNLIEIMDYDNVEYVLTRVKAQLRESDPLPS